MTNPIVTTLADVSVGSEMSFERLSVVPMTLSNPKLPMDCMTLDEALSSGNFEVMEVSEGGQVPELRVVNDGDTRVLLLDGEELIGAKQNRIINLTILVPARANVVIPVSCVEAGRWHRQSRRFAASRIRPVFASPGVQGRSGHTFARIVWRCRAISSGSGTISLRKRPDYRPHLIPLRCRGYSTNIVARLTRT